MRKRNELMFQVATRIDDPISREVDSAQNLHVDSVAVQQAADC
jgi:hypothetical protein